MATERSGPVVGGLVGSSDSARFDVMVLSVTTAVALIAAAAVLLPERLPFQDLLVRAALSDAVGDVLSGRDPVLVATPWPVHGWLYELLAWALTAVMGAELATRALLAAALVAMPLSVGRLLRAAGLPVTGAAFCAPLLLTPPVVMGYVPFVASVPLGVVALASLLQVAKEPGRVRVVRAALWILAAYGFHAFGALAACLAGGAGALVPRGGGSTATRRLGAVALAAAPALALTLGGALAAPRAEELLYVSGPLQRVLEIPARLGNVLISSIDGTVAALALAFIGVGAVLSRGVWRPLLAPIMALLITWLALPDHALRPTISGLADRLLLPLSLVLPGVIALRGRARWLVAAPLALAAAWHSLFLAELLAAGKNERPAERLLRQVPGDATLLGVVQYAFDPRSPIQGSLAIHDVWLHRLRSGGAVIAPFSHPLMPIHLRPDLEAATHHLPNSPGRYVEACVGAADYVLTDVHVPMGGEGWRLESVAEDSGLRLLRVVATGLAGSEVGGQTYSILIFWRARM